jgi:hypothetical protein
MKDNKIMLSINPSNLIAPVRVNEKMISNIEFINKNKLSTFEHEEYNFRSNNSINDFYKSTDRMNKKYKSDYIYEDDKAYEENPIIGSLLPRIFYRRHTNPEN